MTADWILVVGTLIFFITGVATLNFGYARFRAMGAQDRADTLPADDVRASRDAEPPQAAPEVAVSAAEASTSS